MSLKMRNILVVPLLIVLAVVLCSAKEFYDKLDRYIIACHSTDFTCFKRQYVSLRNHILLGSPRLDIADYEPYRFEYGDSSTCIKLSGLEESQLVGIGMDSDKREYTLVLELPLKLQQVANDTKCEAPEHEFTDIGTHTGPLKKFTGNATIEVVYPYDLKKKKGKMYMVLGEEGLDVVLDIPDISEYKDMSADDHKEYELSEWAYEVVQHIDAAQAFALPFTSRMRALTEKVSMERFLLLYPEEEYTDIHFTYNESPLFEMTSDSK